MCKMCGNQWLQKPNHILDGHGCKKCANKNNGIQKRKTTAQFCDELKNISKNIRIIGEYIGANKKILCECVKCGFIWEPIASSLVNNKTGCPKCIGRNKTNDEFIQELPEKIKNYVIFLDEYINSKTKIKCKCLICGNIWFGYPSNLKKGHGCMICGGKSKQDTKTFIDSLPQNVIENVKIIGEYSNAHEKILCLCKKCGNKWMGNITVLKRGGLCPICSHGEAGYKKRKTKNDFIAQIKKINKNINIIGEYSTAFDKIKCGCKICGHIWEALPINLLKGCGCPNCKTSHGEKKINKFLSEHNIKYIPQHKFSGLKGVGNRLLSYDFYLPDYNLLIEFQGEQHERSVEYFGGEDQFKIQQEHDKRKREYSKSHNINLLEIWYYDEDNIEEILIKELNNLKSKSVETVIPA